MEDIIGHILAGIVRGAVALGEAAANATKVIARGTVGSVKVVGENIAEEIVEQALESIEGREKRKQRRFACHIEKLNGHDWFKVIYEDVKCRDVIHTEEHYRNLLSKRRYVHKLIRNENERQQFIQQLWMEAKVDDVIWDVKKD